jgi:hypothetical protein
MIHATVPTTTIDKTGNSLPLIVSTGYCGDMISQMKQCFSGQAIAGKTGAKL